MELSMDWGDVFKQIFLFLQQVEQGIFEPVVVL